MVLSIDMITCMCLVILKTINFVSNIMCEKQIGVIQYSILRWNLNNVYKTLAIDEYNIIETCEFPCIPYTSIII